MADFGDATFMTSAYSISDVRAAEAALMATLQSPAMDGELMSRASFGLAVHVVRFLKDRCGGVTGRRILMLIGSGGNGGDALHAGAQLMRRGAQVAAILCAGKAHEAGLEAFLSAGGRLVKADPDLDFSRYDLVMDAITGIGARGGLRGVSEELAERIAAATPRPLVVAVDVPSGVGVDGGEVEGVVLKADLTVTFGTHKDALLLPPAAELVGRVEFVDIGLAPALSHIGAQPSVVRPSAAAAKAAWPMPTALSHKYTRGVLGVVAGSDRFPGAAVLVVGGASRTGLGMVRYVGPTEAGQVVRQRWPESVPSESLVPGTGAGSGTVSSAGSGAGRVQAWVVGSGLPAAEPDPAPGHATSDVASSDRGGPDQLAQARAAIDTAVRDGLPIVIDAGAISLIPKHLPATAVLTPHAGELASLLIARGEECSRSDVESRPADHLLRAVELTGATILLKGNVTLIAGPVSVAGLEPAKHPSVPTPQPPIWSVASATPWLATAGAGDILAGIIGALLAGRSSDVMADPPLAAELAAIAAMVHGMAARSAAGLSVQPDHTKTAGRPIVASDVIDHLPTAIGEVLR